MVFEDKDIEKLLNLLGPFIVGEIEEIVPFDSKNDEQRNELLQVALKASEISLIILGKFLTENTLNYNQLNESLKLIEEGRFQEILHKIGK